MASLIRSSRSALILGGLLALALDLPGALAGGNQRSTFPGRRIGGATRGECSSRLIAHLVPADSVFTPGANRVLGILEGPTAHPHQVLVSFRPEAAAAAKAPTTITLPAMGPGITLLKRPALEGSTIWESSYRCGTGGTASEASSADPLSFVSSESPPALSLLVTNASPDDIKVQQALKQLQRACGSTVPRAEVASSFGLADVITSDWPERLPVRCPS